MAGAGTSPPGPTAHVTTFYSFKGGVGRSLLLANAGWLLAERRRVLLWDLDLEAPGLHRIPALHPPEVERGFLEWLGSFTAGPSLRDAGGLPKRAAAALARLVLPVPGRPNLSILPAFGDGADFARLHAEGPWRDLVTQEPALALSLFHAVLAVLAEKQDHVLIDSRTGITDVGGLLAALLPHATVLVGGYGHQSLHGLLHVRGALEEAVKGRLPPRRRLGPGEKLQLVHVVSPVPEDVEHSAERRRIWEEVFGELRPLEVPFDRRLLWSERLLADEDPECPTARAYALLAERLSGLRDRLLARSQRAADADARYPESAAGLEPGSRARQGLRFEDRVARLLSLHGYTVEPRQLLAGHGVDLVARITGGLDEQTWWVECKDHRAPVGKDVLEKLAAWVGGQEGRREGTRGMVVARAFTPAAVAFAADHPDLRAWTVDELERRLFDPRPYLHALVAAFEESTLARTYVDQQVLLESRPEGEARVDLLPHALAWAAGEGTRLWLLLGDYGTGKTAFFQRFTYELARRALADPEAPFPIAVDLKEVPNATSVETLLFEHLRRRAPGFRGSPEVLLHLLAAGRCVLLLDAFDEMGVAAAGRSVEEQFRELARLAGDEPLDPRRGNRVLVTCRTHLFRDQQQVKDTAAGRPAGLAAAEDSALGRVARRFNATIDELNLFDDRQIAEFLARHLGPDGAGRAGEFIARTYDLPTLAPRPVLLEIIVRSLPALWQEGEGKVTPAGLYEVYTRQWLEDRSGRNLQTPPPLRHRLLTLLAATLWRRADRQLHHRDLLAEVRRLSGLFPGLDYERVDIELRTAAFLIRSSDGYYRFSHKSFLEYFLARGLWDALGAGDGAAAALDLPPLSPEVGEFFWRLPDGVADERLATLRTLLRSPYRAQASENALRLGAWSRLATGRPFAVENAQLAQARLAGADLRAVALAEADLSGACLEGAVLEGAALPDARLDGASLDGARAAGADLTGASLQRASLAAADLSRARLAGARLAEAVLKDAMLDGADLSAALLTGADLSFASGDAVCFERADLRAARLQGSVWTVGRFTGARLGRAAAPGWLVAGGHGLPSHPRLRRSGQQEVWADFHLGHRSWVRSLAWSPSGEWLASGSSDGSVRVWEVSTGESRRVLSGGGGRVWSVAWSPSGEWLASGGEDGSVRVWEVSTGESRRVLSGGGGSVLSVAWSPSGEQLASGSDDGSVRVWEVSTGESRRVLSGGGGRVLSVAWSPSGEWLASGSDDGSVRVWEVSTGESRRVPSGGGGSVWSVAWSPSGEQLASGGEDGSVRVWEVSTGESRRVLSGGGGSVWSVAWSPSGEWLASGSEDGWVRVWEVSTGESRRVLSGGGGRVWSVAWSPSGEQLASGSEDGSVRVWEVSTGESRRVLSGGGGSVLSVAWSPSGEWLASGSEDGWVRVWEVSTGESRRVLSGGGGSVLSVAWSPSGEWLASGSSDGSVRVWEVSTGESRRVLSGGGGSVLSVAWSPSGEWLASGSSDGWVRVWEVSTGESRRVLSGGGGSVLSVAWSPSGEWLASGSSDGSVRVWEVSTGESRRVLSGGGGSVLSVAWSPSGEWLASGGEDGSVRLWEVSTGESRRVLSGGGGSVLSVAWSPSGEWLASGSSDGSVRVWEVSTGESRRVLSGGGGSVLSVAWSPSGEWLASGSEDGSVRLWDAGTGRVRGSFLAWEDLALATVPGGWFVHSPAEEPLDPRRLRLHLASPGEGPERSWRVLPLAGLARWLESPAHVAAALAGRPLPTVPPEIRDLVP